VFLEKIETYTFKNALLMQMEALRMKKPKHLIKEKPKGK
jgi:hypothetical protein